MPFSCISLKTKPIKIDFIEEALGGCTSVVVDSENKIIAINIPKSAGLEPEALLRYFEENEESLTKGCKTLYCIIGKLMDVLGNLSLR